MNYLDFFGHQDCSDTGAVRTLNQALAEGEFSTGYLERREQFEREEAQARKTAKVAAKVAKKNPWLTELSEAPRRRKPR